MLARAEQTCSLGKASRYEHLYRVSCFLLIVHPACSLLLDPRHRNPVKPREAHRDPLLLEASPSPRLQPPAPPLSPLLPAAEAIEEEQQADSSQNRHLQERLISFGVQANIVQDDLRRQIKEMDLLLERALSEARGQEQQGGLGARPAPVSSHSHTKQPMLPDPTCLHHPGQDQLLEQQVLQMF